MTLGDREREWERECVGDLERERDRECDFELDWDFLLLGGDWDAGFVEMESVDNWGDLDVIRN